MNHEKRVLMFFILAVILANFMFITEISGADNANLGNQSQIKANTDNQENDSDDKGISEEERIRVRNVVQESNRLRIHTQTGECPTDCTCSGSAMKCRLERGGREITITAGKSGNTIVQIKGSEGEMQTNVTLYKSDGKVYGVFRGNITREVKALPDAVRGRIGERIQTRLENETLELNENGNYNFEARKRARLFGFIPVRERVTAEVNAESGEIVRIRKSWWSFLAGDYPEDLILGATCGTVSPDSRSECCQGKGFDTWKEETARCEFSE